MDFLNASFKVGRLSGINVRVHILFIFFVVWRLLQAGEHWQSSLLFLGLLFGIVLVHEFGHCFGARSVGGNAENILMWPLGGLAFAHAPMTPWAQFVTVASGPLVNVVFCVVSGTILAITAKTVAIFSLSPFSAVAVPYGAPEWFGYLALFYHVNYFLLALNLLPVYPLDGGQLFQCLLWPFVGLQQAMRLACQVGLVGCIGFGLWGLSQGGGMLLFIALFGGFTCWQRLKMLKYGMIADERVKYAPYRQYKPRRDGGFFSRIFKVKRRPKASRPDVNPNVGGWQAKADEQARREAEVDRILKKVHTHGLHSLSYVERQTLERATRERKEREREFERKT